MKFLKNLKNKNIDDGQPLNVPSDDIDVFAVLCDKCLPMVKRGLFGRKTYSYYFPADEANLYILQTLFEKNGLTVKYCTRESSGYFEQFLSIEHKNYNHGIAVADFMQSIRDRKRELTSEFYSKRSDATWWKVQEYINSVKQIQK